MTQGSGQGEEKIILEVPRGKEGKDVLRVTFSTFNGYPYIGIREWFKGDSGTMLPSKKGISIKPREVESVIEALKKFGANDANVAAVTAPQADASGQMPF